MQALCFRLKSALAGQAVNRVCGYFRASFRFRERSPAARKNDAEFGELSGPGVDLDRSAVLLYDDVVAERKPEPRPFTGRLGGEKRVENLLLHLGQHAGTVVADADLDAVAQIFCRRHECRL